MTRGPCVVYLISKYPPPFMFGYNHEFYHSELTGSIPVSALQLFCLRTQPIFVQMLCVAIYCQKISRITPEALKPPDETTIYFIFVWKPVRSEHNAHWCDRIF